MEHCFWPRRLGGDVPACFARVYLGEEGCGRFLSSGGFLRQALALMEADRAVTLVTPYLTPQRECELRDLLAKLPAPAEVVANDIGAFALIARAGHIPIAGRLLSRQSTDPAIASFEAPQPPRTVETPGGPRLLRHQPPPASLMEHFRTPAILSAACLEVLQNLSPHHLRVELDSPPHGLPAAIPAGVTASLHAQECLLAVKPCTGGCRQCPAAPVPAGQSRTGAPLHQCKNLLLYPAAPVANPPAWASRLIWRSPGAF